MTAPYAHDDDDDDRGRMDRSRVVQAGRCQRRRCRSASSVCIIFVLVSAVAFTCSQFSMFYARLETTPYPDSPCISRSSFADRQLLESASA
jgi:hypothetical protein